MTVQEFGELIRAYSPHCALVAISNTGQINWESDPDEMVLADEGPTALIAAISRVTRRR